MSPNGSVRQELRAKPGVADDVSAELGGSEVDEVAGAVPVAGHRRLSTLRGVEENG